MELPITIRGMPGTTIVVNETVANAFVRVPDVIDYRQNWQAYKIRLQFGTEPDLRVVTIDAPPPA
jgi:hypothetical protein